MNKFFIHDEQTLLNCIMAETKELAERLTGLYAISVNDKTVEGACLGAQYDSTLNKFINLPMEH